MAIPLSDRIKHQELSILLALVEKMVRHQQETEKLKGEQFNIFSVLKMERSENRTHSAFLTALLDPKGTHQKDQRYLELFLESINMAHHIRAASCEVIPEFHISQLNEDEKTGGRIDILIRDSNGNSISIENKIDAGDQYAQIERYHNYNGEKNIVCYLTLDGREPSNESKGKLISGRDFFLLSYRDDITAWLSLCQREAVNEPILRESIKQYINLIKKMTSTPDNKHEEELIELLMQNFQTAAFVDSAFITARRRIADKIRHEVCEKLNAALPQNLTATIGSPIHQVYAQIWVHDKTFTKQAVYFGIESFNGTGNFGGKLFIGIFNESGKTNGFTEQFGEVRHWYKECLLEFENAKINFGINDLIINIQQTKGFREKLVDQITQQTLKYITENEPVILSFLQSNANPTTLNQSLNGSAI